MRITIHQPEHLPWAGFFGKISQADLAVMLDVVQFRKNYFQNRNRILTPHGLAWVSVPVLVKGHTDRQLLDMRINERDLRWRQRCWGTIENAYRRHPFFEEYGASLAEIYSREWKYLVDLNSELMSLMFGWLGMSVPVRRASELDVSGSSTDLLVEICQRVGATEYVAGPSGKQYLDESRFAAAGIGIRHAWHEEQPYPQWGSSTFIAQVSALDLLFNMGNESLSIISAGSRVD